MSREIEFRAWKDGEKVGFNIAVGLNVHGKPIVYSDNYSGAVMMLCDIVEQYTGHKDRNGKKIFEGDIVSAKGEYPAEVMFNYGSFILRHAQYTNARTPLRDVSAACYEIIGNIHENPGLLEAK